MPDPTPGVSKSVAAVAAGALSTIIAWAIEQVTGHPLPAEIVGSAQTLLTLGAVYFTPHSLGGGS